MRVIVCGSRQWANYQTVYDRLALLPPDTVVVHGAARGADSAAETAADTLGLQVERHPADWNRHGKAAGPIRNTKMAALGADLLIAFWDGDSRGTANMIARAKQHGIPVEVISPTLART